MTQPFPQSFRALAVPLLHVERLLLLLSACSARSWRVKCLLFTFHIIWVPRFMAVNSYPSFYVQRLGDEAFSRDDAFPVSRGRGLR